jgi:hypothetical protein
MCGKVAVGDSWRKDSGNNRSHPVIKGSWILLSLRAERISDGDKTLRVKAQLKCYKSLLPRGEHSLLSLPASPVLSLCLSHGGMGDDVYCKN